MSQSEISNIKQKLSNPVVLVGMMGSGKSHLGRLLADSLGYAFYDSDSVIQEKAGMPVADIFEKFGEAKFRDSEKNTLRELIETGPCVIATGGGALTSEETLELLKADAYMIWLDTDIETIWRRVEGCNTRPLLQTTNPKEKLCALIDERAPLYQQAPMHIKIAAEKPHQALEKLIQALSEYLNKDTV